ncbi:GGDEF domain-containing protein [Rhodoferax sp. GW822-FHT02A01]|uniref:GGDEF domain-containing protein n=1 Tax=Rhodoferax sp. GW822-FHT02A01 TaxID=3141537 RepID=UPI00315CDD5A
MYKIANAIENDLILEVVGVCSSEHQRPDLEEGSKICLDINNPPAEFINEVMAFKRRSVSAVNVPGWGCDIVGSIYMPESLGHGYLLAGDFFGEESDIQTYEVRACEVMCNMLSAVLMKAQFEKLASIDGLTGLMNSRAIREAFEKAFQRQKRKNSGLGAVVLADIDFFKKINDQYGHIQGDSVLQEVGMLFDSFTRKHLDVAGRYGGEEFLLIYEDSDARQVLSIVERLRQSIAGHPFKKIGPSGNPIHGESLPVTMSFGVARLQYDGVTSSKELLAIADAALYQSKEDGRNRVTLGQALASAN